MKLQVVERGAWIGVAEIQALVEKEGKILHLPTEPEPVWIDPRGAARSQVLKVLIETRRRKISCSRRKREYAASVAVLVTIELGALVPSGRAVCTKHSNRMAALHQENATLLFQHFPNHA